MKIPACPHLSRQQARRGLSRAKAVVPMLDIVARASIDLRQAAADSDAASLDMAPERSGELDLLFHLVQPTYWETCKIEGIDLDSDFRWIDDDPDEESLAGLKRRALMDRLMICQKPDDLARIRCQLEPAVIMYFR